MMNQHQTVEKMRLMRMKTMASMYHQALTENQYKDLDTDEFIALMVDNEWEDRQHRKITGLIRRATFKASASPANIDYQSARNLDKTMIHRLLHLNFVKNRENIIITGPSGTGKSYLAQAFGHQACQMLYKTKYYITARLFDHAKLTKLDGSYLKFISQLHKTPLLILDDFGLHGIDKIDRQVLMDLVEERHQKASTIFCSQIPVNEWYALIGEGTIADAILDRVVYSSHRVELEGDSQRKKQKLKK
jgi:DNA replication protein DnaC